MSKLLTAVVEREKKGVSRGQYTRIPCTVDLNREGNLVSHLQLAGQQPGEAVNKRGGVSQGFQAQRRVVMLKLDEPIEHNGRKFTAMPYYVSTTVKANAALWARFLANPDASLTPDDDDEEN